MSGGTTMNWPQQPTYGEGMADALKAQMGMLTGTGDFEEIYREALGGEGTLQDVLRQFEAPMRKETAQLDTDVLRQTLLGAEQKVQRVEQPDGSFKYGMPGGKSIVPEGETAKGSSGDFVYFGGNITDQNTGAATDVLSWARKEGYIYPQNTFHKESPITMKGAKALGIISEEGVPQGALGDMWPAFTAETPANATKISSLLAAIELQPDGTFTSDPDYRWTKAVEEQMAGLEKSTALTEAFIGDFRGTSDEGKPVMEEFDFHNPNIPADPSKAGQAGYDSQGRTLFKEGDVVREETGMLDLFGPKEAGAVTREIGSEDDRYEQYMRNMMTADPAAVEYFEQAKARDPSVSPESQAAAAQGLAAFGRFHHAEAAAVEGAPRPLPEIGEPMTTATGELLSESRRAGFDPQTGEFLGLTTLGADVSEQLARRQRTADIADVQRLGSLATDAYRQQGDISGALATARGLGPGGTRPATAADVAAGRATTVDEGIAAPSAMPSFATQADVDAGRAREVGDFFTGAATADLRGVAQELGYAERAATAEDVAAGRAATAGDMIGVPSITGGRIGGDYRAFDPMAEEDGVYARTRTTTQADVDAGRATAVGQTIATGGTDPLRMAMLQQVQEGLGEGLTERELRTLREGARSRATAMGRTYDPKATMDELKIQLMEDEGRRAQRLQQAQSVLGGEVGIQQADLGRDVQAQLANLQTQQAGIGRELGAAESDVERAMRQQAMSEQYRQAGLGQERAAAASMVGLEQATGADPFQAILGRPSGAGAAMGQQMFGQAGYGLQSQPQYLNPEAGLSYISQAAANEASMWGAGQQAAAERSSGMWGGLGALAGGLAGGPVGSAIGKRMFS